jgi:DNA-binding NarL/FixJ family response regulator
VGGRRPSLFHLTGAVPVARHLPLRQLPAVVADRTASADAPARLCIVDDHPIVRRGLAQLIDQYADLHVVGEAESVDEAVAVLREGDFDLAIVDLSLKGLSGLELIKRLQAEQPDLPVLVLTMYDERFYAERALRAGASGYIMKHEATEKVIEAIRKVLGGDMYLSEQAAQRMVRTFIDSDPRDVSSPIERLSDRELEVFQLLGQGCGTREVAELLHLSVKTIETYRANIKQKLHLQNATELMQRAVQWVQVSRSQ